MKTAYCKPLRLLAEALMQAGAIAGVRVGISLWITMWVKNTSQSACGKGSQGGCYVTKKCDLNKYI